MYSLSKVFPCEEQPFIYNDNFVQLRLFLLFLWILLFSTYVVTLLYVTISKTFDKIEN